MLSEIVNKVVQLREISNQDETINKMRFDEITDRDEYQRLMNRKNIIGSKYHRMYKQIQSTLEMPSSNMETLLRNDTGEDTDNMVMNALILKYANHRQLYEFFHLCPSFTLRNNNMVMTDTWETMDDYIILTHITKEDNVINRYRIPISKMQKYFLDTNHNGYLNQYVFDIGIMMFIDSMSYDTLITQLKG